METPDQRIPCPNFVVCDSKTSKEALDRHGGICSCCVYAYGKWRGGDGVLQKIDLAKCTVCLSIGPSIKQACCPHPLCVDCFRRDYYPWRMLKSPVFPYDTEDADFDPADPLIMEYDKAEFKYDELVADLRKRLSCCQECGAGKD